MIIGEKIRQLRREREMTQEELAEYMNLSVSAVSQWECGKTMPDILQLPALANLFGVSADELLGICPEKAAKRIQAVLEKANAHYAAGKFTESAELLRAGLAEYPNSWEMMAEYADSLNCCGRSEEAAAVCRRILGGCMDSRIRGKAAQHLTYACRDLGRYGEAVEAAEGQTDAWFSRQDLLIFLLKGEKAAPLYREYALFCLNRLAVCLTCLAEEDPSLTEEDRICLYKKIPVLYETYFEDGDLMYQNQYAETACFHLAQLYAGRGEAETALAHLEEAVRYAAAFDTYDQQGEHTSAAARGNEAEGWINSDGNRTSWMLESLADPVFDSVRESLRFAACTDTLKRYAAG